MRPWALLLALSLGPAIGNGLARFGYGLILPEMKADLGWTYTLAGWVNTANALGYLLGALLALYLSGKVRPSRLFSVGMIVTTLALIGSGLTRDFGVLLVMRVLAGVGGAPVFIAGAAMAAGVWRDVPARNALAIAIYFGGAGFGIFLTAVSLPAMVEAWGASSWPSAWLLMGALGGVACIPSILAARQIDDGTGMEVVRTRALPIARIAPSLMGYFLFSAGYVVYMTFVVAWLRVNGAGVFTVSASWALLGLAVMVSPFPWKHVLSRYENGIPLMLATLATGIGSLIPILYGGFIGIAVSAVVFGLSFFIAPSAVTAFTKRNLPQSQWGTAVALYTSIFATGQTLGPIGAGWISDRTGDLTMGLAAGVVTLGLGAVLAGFQRRLQPDGRPAAA